MCSLIIIIIFIPTAIYIYNIVYSSVAAIQVEYDVHFDLIRRTILRVFKIYNPPNSHPEHVVSKYQRNERFMILAPPDNILICLRTVVPIAVYPHALAVSSFSAGPRPLYYRRNSSRATNYFRPNVVYRFPCGIYITYNTI